MSYNVKYGSCRYDKPKPRQRPNKITILISIVIAVFLINLIFPTQIAQIRRHIFPFLEPEVMDAFSEMIGDISEGNNVQDALTVFCKEIIGGAAY